MRPLAVIAAMDQQRVIGRNGSIPWHSQEDFAHFKKKTMGHALIMGRRTFESIGTPLKGRTTIVLARNLYMPFNDALATNSLYDALGMAYRLDSMPFICGGQRLYEQTIPELATKIYLTQIDIRVTGGDTFFPEIPMDRFEETSRQNSGFLTFLEYTRKQ